MNHDIRCRQVQSRAPCLQGNAEHTRIIRLESLYHISASLLVGSSSQQIIRDFLPVKYPTQTIQHGGKLGKQQYLMPSVQGVLHDIKAELGLGRSPLVSFIKQGRITAELTQLRQFCQNLNLIFPELRIRILVKGKHQPLHMGVIQLLLLPFQSGKNTFLQLLRKILQHVPFQAPQHKRTNQLLQTFSRILIPALDNGDLVVVAEFVIGIQITGHEIIKNTPQFTEPVFNRRSCECQPEACADLLDRSGSLGTVVFDVLRLVNDLCHKTKGCIGFPVSLQQIIGGDQDFPGPAALQKLPPFHSVPHNGFYGEGGRKALKLIFPVVDQGRRTHNQCQGTFPLHRLRGFREQICDHLQGLSKTHIICQNTPETILLQSPDPEISLFLIFPEYVLHGSGYFKIVVLHRLHIADQGLEFTIPLHSQGIPFLCLRIQIQRTIFGKQDTFALQLCVVEPQSLLQLKEGTDGFPLHIDKIAVFQAVKLLLTVIFAEDFLQLF